MARESTKIPLKEPIVTDTMIVKEITLQPPLAADFFQLGAPQTWVRTGEGMALIDNDQAIAKYVERCMVDPDPLLAMRHMGVLDAMAVKDAICGFFRDTSTKPAASAVSE